MCGLSSEGPPNYPGGRLQGDATTVFTFYLYQYHRWANSSAVLRDMYSSMVRAVSFTILNAAQSPFKLPCLMDPMWDILAIGGWEHVFYNALWYIASLRAAAILALIVIPVDAAFAATCTATADTAVVQIEAPFWDEGGQYHRPLEDKKLGKPDWFMADSFYAQMHAFTAGIGLLLPNRTRMKLHLATEKRRNLSPKYGIRMLT